MLQEGDSDSVRRCVECGVEGAGPGGCTGGTLMEVMLKECRARRLDMEDAMDRSGWGRQIQDD